VSENNRQVAMVNLSYYIQYRSKLHHNTTLRYYTILHSSQNHYKLTKTY